MKLRRLTSVIAAVLVLMMAAVPALASALAVGEGSMPFIIDEGSGESLVSVSSAVSLQTASTSGSASIESDPSRITGPRNVTITIKLRNSNSSIGMNSIGGTGVRMLSAYFPFPISTLPPITSVPSETEPPVPTPEPIVPTETPHVTSDPIVTSIPTSAPTSGPTAVPQAGRFTHVSISNPYGAVFNTSDVNPGTTGVFTSQMMVYESMIGQKLTFNISWYDTAINQTYSQELSVVIQRSDTAYLRLSRTASVSSAAADEEVEFTYSFVNTGSRRLTNIRLTDDKIIGNAEIAEPFSLGSGERREIKFIYKMRGASVVSKPTATFTPEGSSNVLSVTVSKMTIGLINAQITKSVNVGSATPEGVSFTLFLTNNGSQNLSGLVVKDDLGSVLASGFSLAIGESRIIEHFVPDPDGVRNVVFYINGTYDEGKEFADNTTSYTVRPYINPALLGLKFRAEVRKQLDADNNIGLTFTVENTGRLAYSNIVLSEEQLGYTLHEIHGLAASTEPVSFNIDLTIDEPRELVFILTAFDPSGNEHTFDAHINAQRIDITSSIPNATPEPGGNSGTTIVDLNLDRQISEKGQQLMNIWKVLRIIFIIALIAIVLLAALEYYLYRRKNNSNNG